MGGTRSFTKRYFTSWVSLTAFGVLILGLVVAWISTDMRDSKSVDAYLQSLSTSVIGIALTVWLVNFLLELQGHRLSSELRASTEISALLSLQRFVRRLPHWLPQVEAPDSMHWPQLDWMHSQIDHIRTLCDGISPGPTDPELQKSLNEFQLRQLDWSDALADLAPLIHMTAPAEDCAQAFTILQVCTNQLLDSARALEGTLLSRHEHEKLVLGIVRE